MCPARRTLPAGQVTAITGGSAGDYRPVLAFSAPGGAGATATATPVMNDQGGIASVTLSSGGSQYTSTPTLTITARNSGATAALLDLHLGAETAQCWEWDGTPPVGYDPADPATYPVIGDGTNPYLEDALPTEQGLQISANFRGVCDCSDCP